MAQRRFPTTLADFGYDFNRRGELRNVETRRPFEFVDQNHYDALGEAIAERVYELMETDTHLTRVQVPVDGDTANASSRIPAALGGDDDDDDEALPTTSGPKGFFFMSRDALEADKLMVLIHGAGYVRAGQWARRLIINESLDSGSMLPFIKRAQAEGYGVMVLNGNLNAAIDPATNRRGYIPGNSSPEDHAVYVWDRFIASAAARHIAIVAHSYGGIVTSNLLAVRPDALQRVAGIALTDSVHRLNSSFPAPVRKFFEEHCINWVASLAPLDTPERSPKGDCARVSSGAGKHEETSWAAYESIFPYLADQIANHYF
ncbi:hypothetical protein CAOG_03555 [Capsaspora owczarzaki ATCC 30864]|uniref:Arb2 domain-containing protein n=1 Tax=Capsaspora owczarzaki (strain ATCC 30864) TaxID=595528 RepID=A0A0D2WNG7_CAPO3|nr:hypothetical protein CAOG_03555 [Capsaspora owczarzaki ATCC 30864]KJE92635.1 hypothetical protein CAOG_003555 [Capsaspora owczarzaki ATCC 30864]|eukprot:XP_004363283.1 hypothetical protein CAOG_03555 [Capsaspora owczarzaki ATCC 30864]